MLDYSCDRHKFGLKHIAVYVCLFHLVVRHMQSIVCTDIGNDAQPVSEQGRFCSSKPQPVQHETLRRHSLSKANPVE